MDEIDLENFVYEHDPEFEKHLGEWDYEMCECKGEPPLGHRLGTCKICNRGEGTIFIHKKTGKKYWYSKEDDKYLIPRAADTPSRCAMSEKAMFSLNEPLRLLLVIHAG